jgi:hypothetical protein
MELPLSVALTTKNNPRILIQSSKCHIQNFAANIVKIYVQVADFFEVFLKARAFIIQRFVDAQLILEPSTFF